VSGFDEAVSLFWPAFVASLLAAAACALVGVHVVARRMVVVGVALPQAAALGIALSFHLHDVPVLGNHDAAALAAEGLAVALLVLARGTRLGQDAAAAILFVAAAALSVLVVRGIPRGMEEVRHLVEGNMLAVHEPELLRLALALVPVLLLHLLGGRRLLLVTFDREAAATLGVRTALWETLFAASLAVAVAAGVHATGTLFVFGFLVLPPATGLLLGRTAAAVFGIAAGTAVAAAAAGFAASYELDAPTGPTCCAAALAAFLAAGAGRAVLTSSRRGPGSA
jgi:ABC-type Mn2+/Zn2+ transport system permease subunit